ncbi:MAG: multidrug transporter [Xanthomarina sp.]|uniref:multidrug transporter n=1 Tax=Xanthomarina sp. TaxID=1931211 RepID=UPI000C398883|nr:multidrug transporter [Xanthomarina sp.]MAL23865.1 multidrug transporter [Xanthomarina sp.]MBF61940.1 multidrug transporter [Xanthomarina sp.]MDX1316734.1 multidrug transporter [Xanthomarina gelatinilytica]HAI16968.1 multidrug transporter [Xanthomarina gelatinilytica]
MKNNLILGLAIISMLFSCTTDDTADIVINDNSVINNNGGGNTPTDGCEAIPAAVFNSNLVLEANKCYTISGPVIMASGTNLIINEGVTIEAEASGADVYIAISQGAKITANGTASNPIVMTSGAANPAAGDWGGLIILGRAPINSVTGSATSTSEIASLPFGGTNAADDSGTIRYVRVEYSGGAADGQSENNGFSFYGVGNSTIVEYIQAFEGKDDGVEFFGGTVNASYVSVVNAQDDSIDWTEGYTGTITNAYVKHGADHDKGIEADGYNTDFSNAAGYFSKPTVNNLTIIGNGSTTGNEAIRLRAGTQGIFNNIYIEGFEEAFDLDGDAGDNPTGAGVLSGDLYVVDATFVDVIEKMQNDTGETFTEADFISGDGNGTGTDYATWGASWTVE